MDKQEYYEKEIGRLSARLDNSEKDLNETRKISANVVLLSEQIGLLRENIKEMHAKIDKISDRITAIEQKPAKKWEALTSQIFAILVATVAGLVFVTIGMKR